MDASICMEALEEALVKYGQPEISNSDQGSQFTGDVFTVFVERLWRSIKYEEVYLHAHDSLSQAKAGLAWYIDFTTPPDRNRRSTSGPPTSSTSRRCRRSNRQHER